MYVEARLRLRSDVRAGTRCNRYKIVAQEGDYRMTNLVFWQPCVVPVVKGAEKPVSTTTCIHLLLQLNALLVLLNLLTVVDNGMYKV